MDGADFFNPSFWINANIVHVGARRIMHDGRKYYFSSLLFNITQLSFSSHFNPSFLADIVFHLEKKWKNGRLKFNQT